PYAARYFEEVGRRPSATGQRYQPGQASRSGASPRQRAFGSVRKRPSASTQRGAAERSDCDRCEGGREDRDDGEASERLEGGVARTPDVVKACTAVAEKAVAHHRQG